MEVNDKMREELSELKSGHKLLEYRADQTDKVITEIKTTLGKISKGGYIFMGIFVADSIGAGEAVKIVLKGLM